MVIDVFMQAMEMLREITYFFFLVSSLFFICFGIFLGLSSVGSGMDSPEFNGFCGNGISFLGLSKNLNIFHLKNC